MDKQEDLINNPSHYAKEAVTLTIEPIQLCEQLDFCLGNAFKYLFRYKNKGKPLQDLQKADYYLKRWQNNQTLGKIIKLTNKVKKRKYRTLIDAFKEKQEWLRTWSYNRPISQNITAISVWVEKQIEKERQAQEHKEFWREGQRDEV